MKYWLILVNPLDRGIATDTSCLCVKNDVNHMVEAFGKKYPGETIVVMQPKEMYTSDVTIKLHQFTISDKGETLPV